MDRLKNLRIAVTNVINLCLIAHLLGRSSVANGGQHLKTPKIQAQKCMQRIYQPADFLFDASALKDSAFDQFWYLRSCMPQEASR